MITIAAIVGIFFAGVFYILSIGDEGMMTKAKGWLKSALLGFTVVFTAWLMVTITMLVLSTKTDLGLVGVTNWYTFSCSTVSSAPTGAVPATTTPAAIPSTAPAAK